jgi:hypothetical protein
LVAGSLDEMLERIRPASVADRQVDAGADELPGERLADPAGADDADGHRRCSFSTRW